MGATVGSNPELFDEGRRKQVEDVTEPTTSDCRTSPTEGSKRHAARENGTGAVTQEEVNYILTLNEEHEAMVRELMIRALPPEMSCISAPPPSEHPRGDGGVYTDHRHESRGPHTMRVHSQHSDNNYHIPREQSLPGMSRPGNSSCKRQFLGHPSPQLMQQVEQW